MEDDTRRSLKPSHLIWSVTGENGESRGLGRGVRDDGFTVEEVSGIEGERQVEEDGVGSRSGAIVHHSWGRNRDWCTEDSGGRFSFFV